MSISILTLKTRREAVAKKSIIDGHFNFEAISSFRSGSNLQAMSWLQSFHGASLSNLSDTVLTHFYRYLSIAMGVNVSALVDPQLITLQEQDIKQIENHWISKLKAFQCSFQDIPLFDITERICRVAITINPKDFYYVPDKLKTIRLCLLAMEKEPTVMFFLSEDRLTRALCKKAVSLDAQLIHKIPERHLRKDTWMAAVNQNGLILRHCPVATITFDLAHAAVRSNGAAIAFVPEHLLTPRLCELAIRSTPHGASLTDIPSSFQTEKLRLIAVIKDPMMLAQIPPHEQTEEIRLMAVKSDGMAIQFIPTCEQSKLICFNALFNNMDSYPWVSPLYLYEVILLIQQFNPDPRFPKDKPDAVKKLVTAKCGICGLLAKSYLSQFQAEEVVPLVPQSIRNAQALSCLYSPMELTRLFSKLNIRGALFAQDLNL